MAETKQRIPLAEARRLAAKILNVLSPFCERIEIAGSIRRARPTVGDVDLVALPKDVAGLKARCAQNCTVITDGDQNFGVQLGGSGTQIDIWLAQYIEAGLFTPRTHNFGSLLVCRTGSKDHNIHLCEYAKKLGLKWSPYTGVFRGSDLIASETEIDIFKALGLPYIKPESRELEWGLPVWSRQAQESKATMENIERIGRQAKANITKEQSEN